MKYKLSWRALSEDCKQVAHGDLSKMTTKLSCPGAASVLNVH